jgi:hypothetical protein
LSLGTDTHTHTHIQGSPCLEHKSLNNYINYYIYHLCLKTYN